ncbi:MAG: hypothetical protein MUE48_02345 [Desulfobacterales bacterium]|nr:hypothetical protein [Desulfobacterales bacterium]
MSAATVAPLMKLTLSLGTETPAAERRELAFIFGVGPQGLTPFEQALAGRRVGEEVRFAVAADDAGDFFGHLDSTVRPILGRDETTAFTARIRAVEHPDPREVVRALAEATGHGSCDCGCGCGR